MTFDPRDYLSPPCTPSKLRTYTVRTGLLRALRGALPRLQGRFLDVGSGYAPYKSLVLAPPSRVSEYVGLDLAGNEYQKPDVEWDGRTIPLDSGSFDCAMATEVFEHCPDPEAVMGEVLRVLKPGGSMFFTVPFLWPLHCVPHDEYRYTPFSLERHLRNAGFASVELHALGGVHAAMAQMMALWANRPGKSRRHAWMSSALLLPFVRGLTAIDKPPAAFAESEMVTGLWGFARKEK